jgi:hypothetical protein
MSGYMAEHIGYYEMTSTIGKFCRGTMCRALLIGFSGNMRRFCCQHLFQP